MKLKSYEKYPLMIKLIFSLVPKVQKAFRKKSNATSVLQTSNKTANKKLTLLPREEERNKGVSL